MLLLLKQNFPVSCWMPSNEYCFCVCYNRDKLLFICDWIRRQGVFHHTLFESHWMIKILLFPDMILISKNRYISLFFLDYYCSAWLISNEEKSHAFFFFVSFVVVGIDGVFQVSALSLSHTQTKTHTAEDLHPILSWLSLPKRIGRVWLLVLIIPTTTWSILNLYEFFKKRKSHFVDTFVCAIVSELSGSCSYILVFSLLPSHHETCSVLFLATTTIRRYAFCLAKNIISFSDFLRSWVGDRSSLFLLLFLALFCSLHFQQLVYRIVY